ncbi:MAG TPA: pyridoxal-phosphate dependent enzyme [Candidatus Cloacimonas sp.]|nr:pyridoxal-phosphate dependent enzyme [Candidatus Cloacimonas sp.]
MKSYLLKYRCIECGKEFNSKELHYLCDECGRDYVPGIPLKGVLEAVFDYEEIGRRWKQKPDPLLFSAVNPKFYPPLPVGNTPFFRVRIPGLKSGETASSDYPIGIKFDGLNPSGSYKDRASQLVVADALQKEITEIVTASTGNAACSLACLGASAGLKVVIFAPQNAPPAKLIQIQVHNAELHKVDGSYDDAFKAALEYTKIHNCMCRNTGYHPLTIDGKKSAGIEIYIQNGYKVPDWIVIPVGDGVILTGIYKAFLDLQRAGITQNLPHLLCVQAESSDAITSYWEIGNYHDAENPVTIADSIKVKTPALAHWSVKALIETDGKGIRVSDAEIQEAQLELAKYTGVFAEPSSSATWAGLKKTVTKRWVNADSDIVLLITGHGLKDPGAVKL